MLIDIPKSHCHPEKINIKAFKTDFYEGIKTIKNNTLLSTMIGLGTIVNFAVSPLFGIVIIYFLKEILIISYFQFPCYQHQYYAVELLKI